MPLAAVLAIYARENGAGAMFEPEAAYDEEVASLNDDEASDEHESDTVMSVIDGDNPIIDDTVRMTSHHHAVVVLHCALINKQARRACLLSVLFAL
ncbi:MAG: ClpXP protease specificity-enhancing factor SspB [Enterobacter hormaechei]